MPKFFAAPDKEPTFGEKATNVLAAYAFSVLWLALFYVILSKIGFTQKTEKMNILLVLLGEQIQKVAPSRSVYFVYACLLAPVIEELLCREWPHRRTIAMPWISDKQAVLTSNVFATSVIFGLLHGSVLNVFLQGVGGLALSWVYLRNGKSYLSAVFTHALYNATVIGASTLSITSVNFLM